MPFEPRLQELGVFSSGKWKQGGLLDYIETITDRPPAERKSLFLNRHGYICAIQQRLPCRIRKGVLVVKIGFNL